VSAYVLAGLIVLKAVISYFMLESDLHSPPKAIPLSIALLFLMPIIGLSLNRIYLGQLPPNVWHNPTTIAAVPFALLLFAYSYRKLNSNNLRDYLVLAGLLVLNLLAKPNYLLAFLPVYYLLQLILILKNRDWKRVWGMLIVTLPVVAMLLIQYYFTFASGEGPGSGVDFAPFKVWNRYSHNIPLSLLVSVAFPLYYAAAYFKEARADGKVKLSWAIFTIALLEYMFFAEAGERYSHGNFLWGGVIALYILFLTTSASFFRQKFSVKYAFGLLLFLLHLGTGIFYFCRLLSGGGYF
jgi:hypothetical protein